VYAGGTEFGRRLQLVIVIPSMWIFGTIDHSDL
jgi:hypothetical protein